MCLGKKYAELNTEIVMEIPAQPQPTVARTAAANSSNNLTSFLRELVVFLFQQRAFTYPIFLLLLILIGGYSLKKMYMTPTRTVTVVGVGTKIVAPDQATVSFSLVYPAQTQTDAINGGETKFNAILSSIGAVKPTIEKTAYQVVQNTGTATTGQAASAASGYQYVNAAKITINNPAQAADLVKTLYANGATLVTQPLFLPKDKDTVDQEVQQAAVQDARNQVQQLAHAAGASVGRVVSIQPGTSTGQTGTAITGNVQNSTVANSKVAPDLTNTMAEITIQATTTVTYELQ